MELKVWVEGIQRIVCGVNEKTTCQDVVFALAHATGKTGRFTLIERWRNSERLLAPSEQPLKVLLKWGEHSNDVQFILQWSPLDSTATANKSGQLQSGKGHLVESSCSDNSSTHSPSPLLAKSNHQFAGSPSTLSGRSAVASSPLSQTSGPKKPPNSGSTSSYTSNDSRLWSPYSQNGVSGPTSALSPPHDTTFQNGNGRIPSTTGSMRGATQTRRLPAEQLFYSSSKLADNISADASKLSSPPPYREPPSPSSHQTPPLISPQTGQNSPAMKSLPPYREPPHPNLNPTPNTYGTKIASSPNVSATSGTSTGNSTTMFNGGGGGQGGNSGAHSNANGMANNGVLHGFSVPSKKDLAKYSAVNSSLSPKQDSSMSSINSSNDVENWKTKDQNLKNGEKSPNQNGSIPKAATLSYSSNSNSNYRELIRVVNTQREKLTSQQAELTQFDAEIMFWEGKAREQQKHMDLINKEISRLEVISAQHESQVLSLAHLEEEQEYSQRESVALKSEIDSLRVELEKCDDEIEQCKQRIRMLMDELHMTQHQMAQRQQEWLDKETATLAEIDRLRNELELTRRDTDAATEMCGSVSQEVQSIEASLSEKKKQMERLVAAMKEANLQSLSIQPPEDLIEVHHRSGSTRRMIGSPRQLENAAPTSKNPHGVWV